MRTALNFWRRNPVSAATSTRVIIDLTRSTGSASPSVRLGDDLVGNLMPLAASAQNLGTSPQFGQAVQGLQATTVEGTVLNIVNWGCNVIARGPPSPVLACGVAASSQAAARRLGWRRRSSHGHLRASDG